MTMETYNFKTLCAYYCLDRFKKLANDGAKDIGSFISSYISDVDKDPINIGNLVQRISSIKPEDLPETIHQQLRAEQNLFQPAGSGNPNAFRMYVWNLLPEDTKTKLMSRLITDLSVQRAILTEIDNLYHRLRAFYNSQNRQYRYVDNSLSNPKPVSDAAPTNFSNRPIKAMTAVPVDTGTLVKTIANTLALVMNLMPIFMQKKPDNTQFEAVLQKYKSNFPLI